MNNNAIASLQTAITEKKVVLDNGLTVMVCEMPEYNGIFAVYGTNYGSVTKGFKLGEKTYNLPAGVAHFLEHKMFENEEGVDAFSLYAKTGASANAFTSFDKTCYIFGATNNFAQSLDILLSFVSKPFFTEKTIEKEQGIIGQEINMYDDNAEWRMMFALLEGLYHNCPVRDDIAGTVESISKITPEILYACTNAFYRPENMVLSVAGNITVDEVVAACRRADIKAATENVEIIYQDEPREINKKETVIKMEVSQPILGIGFKEIPVSRENIVKTEIICDILTELITGDSSDLYCDLYDKGLVNSGFSGEFLNGDGYLAVFFSGETKEPQAVENALRAEINRLKTEGIDEERFACVKNILLGEIISGLEKTETTALGMAETFMQGITRFDEAKILAETTVQDVQNALCNMLSDEYSVKVTILPK